jgi:transcriptional regulator with XRE-family HTH domain
MMTVFRERLVKLLREKRMEQKELADEIKVSSRTVSAYVTGRAYPSVEGLVKIAQTLNVSTDYLLGSSVRPKR